LDAVRHCFADARYAVAFAVLGVLSDFGCYDTKTTQVRVRTPNTDLDCVATADRVFGQEGFVTTPNVTGTRFYSLRASVTTAMALAWGIAVSIEGGPGKDGWAPCTFELQALSIEEGCGLQCPLTPAPGYDDITRKMAELLDAAFRIPRRGAPARATGP
jgi:hypothetical protein